MAEFHRTPEQQAVVDHRGSTLLVSAAAGSGKTTVLVDRLINRICDPESPCDINEFLIITYTRAAAEELRMKISEKLSARLAADPGNRHLQRQMNLLYLTQISTVHAFCAAILREYAHQVDLPPDFRIADEQLCGILQNRAVEDVLESAYEHLDERKGLPVLLDIIGSKRDDTKLAEVVLQVYNAVQSHPYPEKWIAECRQQMTLDDVADAGGTIWGEYLIRQVRTTAAQWKERMEHAIARMQNSEQLTAAYLPAFQRAVILLDELSGSGDSWDALYQRPAPDWGKLNSVTKPEDPDLKNYLQVERNACKDAIKNVLKPFAESSREVLADLKTASEPLQTLFDLVEQFSDRYQSEKQRRRLADYNDLEHEAIHLLTTETGAPSPIAEDLSRRYREIMVDEYQDSNAVQETIFQAISADGKNRFLVGDVKQSIYRFRLADPRIFLEKYNHWKHRAEASPAEPCRQLMSCNFRSDPQILDAVNFIFRNVMSEPVGELAYGDEEALRAPEGRQSAFPDEKVVELYVIEQDLKSTEEEKEPSSREVEAGFVTSRICTMVRSGEKILDGEALRPVRYGDIVILMRSPGSSAGPYIRKLEEAGIPVYCDRGGSLFDTQEAAVLVSLLQIIDNPRRDIPLICVLQSPLAQFSSNELAEIRLLKRKGDFWDALQLYAADSEKAQQFLALLQDLRAFAPTDTVARLLDRLCQKTQIKAIYGAMPGGMQRIRNLETLCDLALNFEGSVMDFLTTLEGARAQGLPPAAPKAADNCVRIMTIHQSKGLEFPVVFLSDLMHGFNKEDSRKAVLVHSQFGLGSCVLDSDNLVRYPTIARKAVAAAQKREMLSEEMRVLYVAMTRPKSRLIMTMCKDGICSKIRKKAGAVSMPVPVSLTASVSSPGEWILMAALCRQEAEELRACSGVEPEIIVQDNRPWLVKLYRASESGWDTVETIQETAAAGTESIQAEALPDLRAWADYAYPYQADTRIPSKLTATQLKGRSLDQETAEGAGQVQLPDYRVVRPRFRHGPVPLTAAEKGTATHLVMQFADFSCCGTVPEVEAELKRLVEYEFITQQQADAVHPDQIAAFFASSMGQRLSDAENLLREFKFSILIPASEMDPAAVGEILLQGVVDCCLLEEDGLTIVDFKTDHVTSDTIGDRAEYYRGQLDAYSSALEKIFDRPVRERVLYFFHAGQSISL